MLILMLILYHRERPLNKHQFPGQAKKGEGAGKPPQRAAVSARPTARDDAVKVTGLVLVIAEKNKLVVL